MLATLFFLIADPAVKPTRFEVPYVTESCPFAEAMLVAIWKAEGAEQARSPYGVLSVPVRDKAHAKQITLVSITLNWRRWLQAGKPGGNTHNAFVTYFAGRWCPVATDPVGHRNWVSNVRALLARELRRRDSP